MQRKEAIFLSGILLLIQVSQKFYHIHGLVREHEMISKESVESYYCDHEINKKIIIWFTLRMLNEE